MLTPCGNKTDAGGPQPRPSSSPPASSRPATAAQTHARAVVAQIVLDVAAHGSALRARIVGPVKVLADRAPLPRLAHFAKPYVRSPSSPTKKPTAAAHKGSGYSAALPSHQAHQSQQDPRVALPTRRGGKGANPGRTNGVCAAAIGATDSAANCYSLSTLLLGNKKTIYAATGRAPGMAATMRAQTSGKRVGTPTKEAVVRVQCIGDGVLLRPQLRDCVIIW